MGVKCSRSTTDFTTDGEEKGRPDRYTTRRRERKKRDRKIFTVMFRANWNLGMVTATA
jgi:hypothetical protein